MSRERIIFGPPVAVSRYESGVGRKLVAIKPLLVEPRINTIDADLYRAHDVSPNPGDPDF